MGQQYNVDIVMGQQYDVDIVMGQQYDVDIVMGQRKEGHRFSTIHAPSNQPTN
jgi:hypothetical protein